MIDLTRWPAEPPPLGTANPARLARALEQLCPVWVAPQSSRQTAQWIIKYSHTFGVDPALLAALIAHQSLCQPRRVNPWGRGLAMINVGMYGKISGGRYPYGVFEGGSWRRRWLSVAAFPFHKRSLGQAEPNIYFAAAFLSMYQQQCPAIDGHFGSVPHRHFVSHFIFGDRVRSTGPEALVLTYRRRLLEHYHDRRPAPRGRFRSLVLGSPLDGTPRLVSSGWGDERDNDRRQHRGVDYVSHVGEPVRAIAPGVVTLAGVDWIDRGRRRDGCAPRRRGAYPRRRRGPRSPPPPATPPKPGQPHEPPCVARTGRLTSVAPNAAALVPRPNIGARGLLVVVQHAEGLSSLYMHLARYTVSSGQTVKRGDLIGFVGRSGIAQSDPHLHLSLHVDERPVDPMPLIAAHAFSPEATWSGRAHIKQLRNKRQLRSLRGRARKRRDLYMRRGRRRPEPIRF